MKWPTSSWFHNEWVLGIKNIFMSCCWKLLWSFQQVSFLGYTVSCSFNDIFFSSKNGQTYFVTDQVWVSWNLNQFCMLVSISKLANKTFLNDLLRCWFIIEYLNWDFLGHSLVFIERRLLRGCVLFVSLLSSRLTQWHSFELVHDLDTLR